MSRYIVGDSVLVKGTVCGIDVSDDKCSVRVNISEHGQRYWFAEENVILDMSNVETIPQEEVMKSVYEQGLNDAWELAKKVVRSPKLVENAEFGQIRTVQLNNETYFVGKDIAEALGYSNSRKALADHVAEEDKGVTKCDTLGGKQDLAVINESGLYALIFGSKLESAKRFKHWVTGEILPQIRRTGTYSVANYQPKATSVGEVANLLKIIERTMKAEKQSLEVIAKNIEIICRQFGIELTEDFTKTKDYEQMALMIVGVK